jgi:hypothetical protein
VYEEGGDVSVLGLMIENSRLSLTTRHTVQPYWHLPRYYGTMRGRYHPIGSIISAQSVPELGLHLRLPVAEQ